MKGRPICSKCAVNRRLRVQRHRDGELWRKLQREGYKSIEQLETDVAEVRASSVLRGEMPRYLRKLWGQRRGLENVRAEDLLPKKQIIERLRKI